MPLPPASGCFTGGVGRTGLPPVDGEAANHLTPAVIPWYDPSMKTAISLPDDLFASAEDLAERLGMSRSELYATAVAEYLAKHRDEDVTARLNEVFGDQSSGIDPNLRSAQARSVGSAEW